MSPTSIATALAMARAGADGATGVADGRACCAPTAGATSAAASGSLEQILNGHNATWEDDEGTPTRSR